jgi:hypothetical protein
MAIPKIIGAQRDFSAGELDEAVKRADENPIIKTGARRMSNWRVLSGGQAQNRSGRRALFLEKGRVEEVLMSPGNIFFLAFGDGYLAVYNAAGTQVAFARVRGDGYTFIPWKASNAASVVFCVIKPLPQPQIVITYPHGFPNNVPIILTWDGVSQTSTWSISDFAEAILASGQKRTIFDRLSKANVTILPSAITGNITLQASDSVFTAGMVGCHLLWCGREVLLTGYASPTLMYAKVIEQLPNTCQVDIGTFEDIGNGNQAFIPGATGYFLPGDLVEGSISGTRGIVISSSQVPMLAGAAQALFFAIGTQINVQIIPTAAQSPISYYLEATVGSTQYFIWKETITGTNGNGQVGAAAATLPPSAVSIWDDEVMNNYRGWPTSCFYDQNRLGFCGFGDSPNAIAWSAIGLTNDFYVNDLATEVNADNAIFETAPTGPVQFVVPGMESSEFVFCDNAIYYIPITPAAPLTPGSVQFNLLTSQGNYPGVQPKQIQQSILYVRAGGASIGAVQTPGYYWRPNIIDVVSELHSHLFTASAPIALACPQAPGQFEENYAYLLQANGTVVMTKYLIRNGLLEPGQDGKPKTGWLPWTGIGMPTWITAQAGDVVFTTSYPRSGEPFSAGFSNGFGGMTQTVSIVEILDDTQYLDASILVNAAPAALAPPSGQGKLWFMAGGSVTLLDNGLRLMGTYQIDSTGHIIPRFIDGENLASPALVAGQPWTAEIVLFPPDAPPGTNAGQRMKKRRASRMTVYVTYSSGFMLARLQTEMLPGGAGAAPGTIMNTFRIPPYLQGDIPTNPVPLRESAYHWRPLGRSFDPRLAIIKDTPGPLLLHEVVLEISI